MPEDSIEKKVLDSLDSVIRFMKEDHGGLQIVYAEETTIKIKTTGHCADCKVSKKLLIDAIENKIKHAVPSIKRIIIV